MLLISIRTRTIGGTILKDLLILNTELFFQIINLKNMRENFKIVVGLFLIILFNGCDNYSETNMFFSSDKAEYTIGEDIILTLHIIPEKRNKRIKFYSDLSNIEIDGLLRSKRNPEEGLKYKYEKVKKDINKIENREILQYRLSPESPLEYDIKGKLTLNENYYKIDFPSIETTFYIDKEKYLEAESFGFKGYCEPINAPIGYSYEDFIDFLPIKIKE